jgi:DNA-binding SARP family transcriptional activator
MPEGPAVEIYTLSSFRVLVGGHAVEESAWRRRSARQVLKVLLTRPGRRMTRDEVVDLFWPESDPEASASNLRSTLYALRRALQVKALPVREVVFADRDSVWLSSQADVWCDADAFEQKIVEAWRSQDPLPLLDEASVIYAGDFLPDDLYEDWASARRELLRQTWTELQIRSCASGGISARC